MAWRELWPQIEQIEVLPAYMLAGKDWAAEEATLGFAATYLYRLHHQQAAQWPAVRSLPAADQDEMSLVALLATTEHVTAANVRKDLVAAGAIDPAAELHTLDVLLGSPLFKHAKSPVLWFHRRWLLERHPSLLDLDRELAVVGQAAAHHPTNYYAWAYARTLAGERVADWAWQFCRTHVSDVSAWTFLAHVTRSRRRDAAEIMERWPHEAVAVYLRLTHV